MQNTHSKPARLTVTLEPDAPPFLSVVLELRDAAGAWEVEAFEELGPDTTADVAAKVTALYLEHPDLGERPEVIFAWHDQAGGLEMTARHLTAQPMSSADGAASFTLLAERAGIPADRIAESLATTQGSEGCQLAEDRDVHAAELAMLRPLLDLATRASSVQLPQGGA